MFTLHAQYGTRDWNVVGGDVAQLLVLAAGLIAATPSAWAQEPVAVPLFAPAGAASAAALEMPAEVLRQRLVGVDLVGVEQARVQAGSSGNGNLRLNLFDDAVFEAVITDTGPTSAGYWLTGHLVGQELASVSLVVNGEVVVGTVHAPGGMYVIRWLGNDLYSVRQLDPAVFLPLESDVLLSRPRAPLPRPARVEPIRAPASAAVGLPAATAPVEDGSRIDILFVYTPAARVKYGGVRALWALFDLAITEANQAYADSAVIQRVHLAHAAEVSYVEGDWNPSYVLSHLMVSSDGYMDEAHALRDRYAADIVYLLADGLGGGIGEVAVRKGRDAPRGHPELAFSVGFNPSGLLFAHEAGHNMGLGHDRYAILQGGPLYLNEVLPYPYSVGYVNQRMFEPGAPAASRWWTIMATGYQCQDWAREHGYHPPNFCHGTVGYAPRFSNPYWTFNGDPTGVRGSAPSSSLHGPSDARASLNRTRHILANFRRAPCLDDGTRIRLQASNGQYVVALNNGGGRVLANRDRPSAWGRLYVVDLDGGCLESGDTVALRTSDGFYLRADGGGGSTLSATGGAVGRAERFTLRRRVPHGRRSARTVEGAVRSGDFLSLQASSGHYVWAERGGGGAMRADRPTYASRWGTFKAREVR